MASITNTVNRVYERQPVSVYVAGKYRRDFVPLQLIKRAGFTPDTALLFVPWAVSATDLSDYDEQLVVIYVDNSSVPAFRGYLSARTAEESISENRVVIQAISVTGYLNRIPVGWAQRRGEVLYTKRDRVTGLDSGYTLADLMYGLQAITLDSNWIQHVQLGDVNVLKRTGSDLKPTSLRFTGASFADGMKRILAYTPDIGLVERHTESKTLLDFYKWGDHPGVHSVRAADEDYLGPEAGATVTGFSKRDDDGALYTRAIAYGAPFRWMVTFSTLHLTAPITPAWSGASTWYSPAMGEGEGVPVGWNFTTAEERVLEIPERANPSSAFYVSGYDDIFKTFQLPPAIWRIYQISRDNVATVTVGGQTKRIELQVFRRRFPLIENETNSRLIWNEAVTDYELLDGVKITEDGYIQLREPLLQDYELQHDGSKILKKRRPVDLFVTATIARSDGDRPYYDTGVRASSLPSIGDSGLVYTMVNDDVSVDIVAAPAGYIQDWYGYVHGFDCIYYNESSSQWQSVAAASAQIVRDDRLWLANISERALAERSRKGGPGQIDLAYLATVVTVGDGVRLLGRGRDNVIMTVISIQFDFVNQRTRITASDLVPTVVSGRERVGDGFRLVNDLMSQSVTAPELLQAPDPAIPSRFSDGTIPDGVMGPPLPAGYEKETGFRDGIPTLLDPRSAKQTNQELADFVGPRNNLR